MRPDSVHVAKIERAISRNDAGDPVVKLDIPFMRQALTRLSLWEGGVLMQSLMRAAAAKRRTAEQRALLALFVHNDMDDGGAHA